MVKATIAPAAMAPQLTRLLTPKRSAALGRAVSAIGLPPSIEDISLRFARTGPGNQPAPGARRHPVSILHGRSPEHDAGPCRARRHDLERRLGCKVRSSRTTIALKTKSIAGVSEAAADVLLFRPELFVTRQVADPGQRMARGMVT